MDISMQPEGDREASPPKPPADHERFGERDDRDQRVDGDRRDDVIRALNEAFARDFRELFDHDRAA